MSESIKNSMSVILPGLMSRWRAALLLILLPLPVVALSASEGLMNTGGAALAATPLIALAGVALFAVQVYYVANCAETALEEKKISIATTLSHAPGVFVVSIMTELLALGIYIIDAKLSQDPLTKRLFFKFMWGLLCFPISAELWFRYFYRFSKLIGHSDTFSRKEIILKTYHLLTLAGIIFVVTIFFEQSGVGLIVNTLLSILSSIIVWECLHYSLKESVQAN